MEIQEIKKRLPFSTVLHYYNLQPKNSMLKCFMHDDKTASLQVNLEKNFYKCHACGKTGDVIQFIEDYEKLSKHEAIKKAESLISSETKNIQRGSGNLGQTKISSEKSALFLEKVYLSFRKGIFSSVPAKEYVKKRALKIEDLQIGFNSGQLHHGDRKTEELIQNLLDVGLLSMAGINSRTGGQAYKTFGIKSIVFPLKNKENQIVSFYFRSILDKENAKHFYLKNRSGIYPGYPKKETKKLILTEAIIDCASLLQIKEIRDNYSIISCFGTNGLNEEILNSIESLENLEEIIFCFDQDKAGKEAVRKYAENLRVMSPTITLSTVELPNNDVNETLQLHDEEIFTKLLEERKFIFSTEKIVEDPYISAERIQVTEEKEVAKIGKEEIVKNSKTLNATDFLQQKDLLKSLNQLIEKAGIIGEENSRLLLFLITIS